MIENTTLIRYKVLFITHEVLLGATITVEIYISPYSIYEKKRKNKTKLTLVAFLYWSSVQFYFISARLLPPSGESNSGYTTGIIQDNEVNSK